MNLDPDSHILLDDHSLLYRVITNLAFETLVKWVMIEQEIVDPVHVTLQVKGDQAILFVKTQHAAFLTEDAAIRELGLDFIGGEVFGLDSSYIHQLYLDGAVGSQDAYVFIEGDGIFITSGRARSKGRYH